MPTGVYYRQPEIRYGGVIKHSDLTKKLISQSCKLKGVGKWMTGKKRSLQSIEKASIAMRLIDRFSIRNPNWKGDSVGYPGIHAWVRKILGQPHVCAHCKTNKKRMYHWANVSGSYKRDIKDWVRLCVPCHRQFDLNKI